MTQDEDMLTTSIDPLPEDEKKKQEKEDLEKEVKEEPEKEVKEEEKKEKDTEQQQEADKKTKDMIKDAIQRSSIAASTATTLPKEVSTLNAVTIVHNAESTYAAASAVLQTDVDDKRTITETEVTVAEPKEIPVPIPAAVNNNGLPTMPPPMYDEGAPNMNDQAAWMAMFEELKLAYKNHGEKGKEETDLVKLGRLALWVSRQRMYRHKLTEKQEKLLEKLAKASALRKIALTQSERDLIAFYAEQKRPNPSRTLVSNSNNANQCTNFTEHFDWGKQNLGGNHLRWQQMWSKLVEFKRAHGHVKVPIRWPHNPTLGKWVSRQRDTAAVLSHERCFKLNQLGFVWQCGNNTIHSRKQAEDRARVMAEEQAKKGKDIDPDAVFEVLMEQERKRLQKEQMSVTKSRVKRIKIQQQNLRDYKRGIKTPPPSHSSWKSKAKCTTPPSSKQQKQKQKDQLRQMVQQTQLFQQQQLQQEQAQQYQQQQYEQQQMSIYQQQQQQQLQQFQLPGGDMYQQALMNKSLARNANNVVVDLSNTGQMQMLPQNNNSNNNNNGNYYGNINAMMVDNNHGQAYYDPSYKNGNTAQNNMGGYFHDYDDASISSTDTDDSCYHYSDNFFHIRYQRQLEQQPMPTQQQQQQCPSTPTRGTRGNDPAATPLINNRQPQARTKKRSSTRHYGGYGASDPFSPSPTKVQKLDMGNYENGKAAVMHFLTEHLTQEHDPFINAKQSATVTPHSASPGSLSPARQPPPVSSPASETPVWSTPKTSEAKLTIQMQPGSAIFSPTKTPSQSNKKRKQSPVSQEEESRSFAMACCRRLNKSDEDWKRKQQWTFVCK